MAKRPQPRQPSSLLRSEERRIRQFLDLRYLNAPSEVSLRPCSLMAKNEKGALAQDPIGTGKTDRQGEHDREEKAKPENLGLEGPGQVK
jgi:hypothetical protein